VLELKTRRGPLNSSGGVVDDGRSAQTQFNSVKLRLDDNSTNTIDLAAAPRRSTSMQTMMGS
jgi:hypothetical protein